MKDSSKKTLAAVGGGLTAAFAVAAFHPLILPVAAGAGAYAGYRLFAGKRGHRR